jgi:2-oxoglutarate dehydrogenase E1 component
MAKSAIAEMGPNTRFQRVIPEVLHPNPLTDAATLSENNVEPRIPYMLSQDPSCPPAPASPIPSSLIPTATPDFTLAPPSEIKTLIFCSGQVYYTLNKARALNGLRHVAIVRIEQLNPFPFWEVKQVVDFYKGSLEEIVWTQEESFNSGSWSFVESRLETAVRHSDWFESEKVCLHYLTHLYIIDVFIFFGRVRIGSRLCKAHSLLED